MNSSELVLLSFLILLQKGRILMKYCMDHIPDIDRPSSIKLISYTIHILVFLCLLYLTFCQYFCIDMILKIAEIIGNDYWTRQLTQMWRRCLMLPRPQLRTDTVSSINNNLICPQSTLSNRAANEPSRSFTVP